jgi:arsenate reductase
VNKERVLFLCTHNSARSQMAEGLLRAVGGERFEVFSAGTEATHVRPLAIRAMKEIGIDISDQESKTLDRYWGQPFDYVITVCDNARENCPVFPGAGESLHWGYDDPAAVEGPEDVRREAFRRTFVAMGERISQFATLVRRERRERGAAGRGAEAAARSG